jgi:hypothetical protein
MTVRPKSGGAFDWSTRIKQWIWCLQEVKVCLNDLKDGVITED